MNVQADPGTDKVAELRKKAAYYDIKADLEAGEITIKQAQKLWTQVQTKLKKKEEAK
jgi:hypothetical protein